MLSPLLPRLRLLRPARGTRDLSVPRRTISRVSGDFNRSLVSLQFRGPQQLLRIGRPADRSHYSSGYAPYRDTHRSAVSATWLIIALNTGVFAGWQYANSTRDSRLQQRLYDYFTVSWSNVREGRPWTVLTSAFSHISITHFAFNMLTFLTFGTMLSWVPGIGAFHVLAVSLGSGVAGSAAWLYQVQSKPDKTRLERIFGAYPNARHGIREMALGASGMVMGVGVAAACLMPLAPITVMFFIPMPLWVATLGFAAVDTYFLHSSEQTGIGHAAHLGGAVWGVAYYAVFLRRYGGVLRWMRFGRR